jgi:hypothetical protein
MNASIRAHRILRGKKRFESAATIADNDWTISPSEKIGSLIGICRNAEYGRPDLLICCFGIEWQEEDRKITIRYDSIERVELTNGKQSKSLELVLGDDRSVVMPVAGNDGKFFDSLEMLRFLMRVMKDLIEYPEEWKLA